MQTVVGRCSSATGLGVGDAGEWRDFARFVSSKAQERPIVFGANLLSWRLRPDKSLESVTLETLSSEVVVGLMGVTLMNPRTTAQ